MKIKRLLITTGVLLLVIGAIVGLMNLTGLNTLAKIQLAVSSSGFWGYFVYFLLTLIFMLGQFLPTALIVIAGVYVFGLWQGIILGIVSVILGSTLIFFLGRKFGTKIVKWVAGNEDITKWQDKIMQGKYTLFLMLIFPLSPDSLLYCLMGTSKMNFATFFVIVLFSKPLGVITTALLGGGAIIPFTWAFAWLWALLGLGAVALMYCSFKYQDKIDKFFLKLTKKK